MSPLRQLLIIFLLLLINFIVAEIKKTNQEIKHYKQLYNAIIEYLKNLK